MKAFKIGLIATFIGLLVGLGIHSRLGGQAIVGLLLSINLLMLVRICRKHSR